MGPPPNLAIGEPRSITTPEADVDETAVGTPAAEGGRAAGGVATGRGGDDSAWVGEPIVCEALNVRTVTGEPSRLFTTDCGESGRLLPKWPMLGLPGRLPARLPVRLPARLLPRPLAVAAAAAPRKLLSGGDPGGKEAAAPTGKESLGMVISPTRKADGPEEPTSAPPLAPPPSNLAPDPAADSLGGTAAEEGGGQAKAQLPLALLAGYFGEPPASVGAEAETPQGQ